MANAPEQETQHAILVVWSQFAQEIGLISSIKAVAKNQKTYEHSLQAKVLGFLIAILSVMKHLQEINLTCTHHTTNINFVPDAIVAHESGSSHCVIGIVQLCFYCVKTYTSVGKTGVSGMTSLMTLNIVESDSALAEMPETHNLSGWVLKTVIGAISTISRSTR